MDLSGNSYDRRKFDEVDGHIYYPHRGWWMKWILPSLHHFAYTVDMVCPSS